MTDLTEQIVRFLKQSEAAKKRRVQSTSSIARAAGVTTPVAAKVLSRLEKTGVVKKSGRCLLGGVNWWERVEGSTNA